MNKVRSKIYKLFSLPPKEIAFRLKERLFESLERVNYKLQKKPRYFENKTLSAETFFLSDCDTKARSALFSQYGYTDTILQEADSILGGQVNLLGMTMHIPQAQGWHIDPESGVSWPFLFYKDVLKHGAVTGKDVKYVWEINRHQYLIPLAKAYFLTGKEAYAKKIFTIIVDWINANPYNQGVNWTSSLEHAVRLFSWIWALNLCRTSPEYVKKISKIKHSVFEQATDIFNHLSHYSSPYNHLIGEAAALFLAGSQFPGLKNAQTWKKTGWGILDRTVEDQFHCDGMTVEQAFFYHHFTLGFYVTCILIRRMNKEPVPNRIMERIKSAMDVSRYIHMPDNTVPMRGDIDNARSICFSNRHSWDFSFFQDLAVVLFKGSGFKKRRQVIPEELLWLLDEQDMNTYLDFHNEPDLSETALPSPEKIFKKSGYAIIKDSWNSSSNFLCFDFGPIAHGLSHKSIPSAAHGHADVLSIDLCAFGKPFLVDGGFNTYFGDLHWHKFFRMEEAHNTFMIQGLRQAQYVDRLTWQKAVSPELLFWENDPAFVSCKGKVQYTPNTSATRQVYYQKQSFWIINDCVDSPDNLHVTHYFNFHPDVNLTQNPERFEVTAEHDDTSLMIKFLNKAEIKIVPASDSTPSGWICQGYGYKTQSLTLHVTWTALKPHSAMPFIIIPFKKTAPPSFPSVKWNTGTGLGAIHLQEKTFKLDLDDNDQVTCTP
nr:alginate lyase family protein [uncultured Desulfobacter sp.]